jgi:hypothetical protein
MPGISPLTCPSMRLPAARYCKTDDHPEILIPCWHIYQHNYSATYLATIPEREALHPWHSRKQVLYNNPGAYHRYASHELTQKLNYTGEPTEMPRQAFAWVPASLVCAA